MASREDIIISRKGTLVEVSIDEDGFTESRYLAKILKSPSSKSSSSKFLVQYQTLTQEEDDDTQNSKALQEYVDASCLRPLPPTVITDSYEPNDVVDAFYRDGWWTGTVTKVLDNGTSYSVFFNNPPEVMEFHPSDLRLHFQWLNQNWVRPQNQETIQQKQGGILDQRKSSGKPTKVLTRRSKAYAADMEHNRAERGDGIESSIVKGSQQTIPLNISGHKEVESHIKTWSQLAKVKLPHEIAQASGEQLGKHSTVTNGSPTQGSKDANGEKVSGVSEAYCMKKEVEMAKAGLELVNELSSIKDREGNNQDQSKEVKSENTDPSNAKTNVRKEIDEIDKILRELQEKRALLVSKKESEEYEIAKLQSRANAINEGIQRARLDFGRLVAAPF